MSNIEKVTIVFIHGNSSSGKVFKRAFNDNYKNVDLIFIDLPGHGKNQNKNYTAKNFSIENYNKYLLENIKDIKVPILLVGNSLGGHIAIEVAPKIKNLAGLVIFGTPPVKKPINFEEAFTQNVDLSSFLEEEPKKNIIKEILSQVVFNKSKVDFFVKDFFDANPKVRTATKSDLFESNFADEYTIFTQLTVPKFIIIGKNDPTVNHNYIDKVKKDCVNSCKIIYFENCGHYPSYEKPKEFDKTILKIAKKVF